MIPAIDEGMFQQIMGETLDPMAEEVRPRSIEQLESNARLKADAHMIRYPHTRESINSEEAEQLAAQAREDFVNGLAPQSADDVYMATYNEQSAQLDKAYGMIKEAK